MVFDAIYDTFAKIVDSKMKDKNVDDEIFGFKRDGKGINSSNLS